MAKRKTPGGAPPAAPGSKKAKSASAPKKAKPASAPKKAKLVSASKELVEKIGLDDVSAVVDASHKRTSNVFRNKHHLPLSAKKSKKKTPEVDYHIPSSVIDEALSLARRKGFKAGQQVSRKKHRFTCWFFGNEELDHFQKIMLAAEFAAEVSNTKLEDTLFVELTIIDPKLPPTARNVKLPNIIGKNLAANFQTYMSEAQQSSYAPRVAEQGKAKKRATGSVSSYATYKDHLRMIVKCASCLKHAGVAADVKSLLDLYKSPSHRDCKSIDGRANKLILDKHKCEMDEKRLDLFRKLSPYIYGYLARDSLKRMKEQRASMKQNMAIRVQRCWRGRCRRRAAEKRRLAKSEHLSMQQNTAIRIQKVWRWWRGKQRRLAMAASAAHLEKQHNTAIRIQKVWREWREKRRLAMAASAAHLEMQHNTAIRIQKVWRGKRAAGERRALKQHNAVTCFQKAIKGYVTRRRFGNLVNEANQRVASRRAMEEATATFEDLHIQGPRFKLSKAVNVDSSTNHEPRIKKIGDIPFVAGSLDEAARKSNPEYVHNLQMLLQTRWRRLCVGLKKHFAQQLVESLKPFSTIQIVQQVQAVGDIKCSFCQKLHPRFQCQTLLYRGLSSSEQQAVIERELSSRQSRKIKVCVTPKAVVMKQPTVPEALTPKATASVDLWKELFDPVLEFASVNESGYANHFFILSVASLLYAKLEHTSLGKLQELVKALVSLAPNPRRMTVCSASLLVKGMKAIHKLSLPQDVAECLFSFAKEMTQLHDGHVPLELAALQNLTGSERAATLALESINRCTSWFARELASLKDQNSKLESENASLKEQVAARIMVEISITDGEARTLVDDVSETEEAAARFLINLSHDTG